MQFLFSKHVFAMSKTLDRNCDNIHKYKQKQSEFYKKTTSSLKKLLSENKFSNKQHHHKITSCKIPIFFMAFH